MENRRAWWRSQQHRRSDRDKDPESVAEDKLDEDLDRDLDDFERQRASQTQANNYEDGAFLRMEDADELLREHSRQRDGDQAPADDPVKLLLAHDTMWAHANPWLYVLALGEKVAALGGHLEVNAVFDDQTLTLIREPGSEGHPPILHRVDGMPAEPDLQPFTAPDLHDPNVLIDVPLTESERFFLNGALVEWGGSATPTDQVARLIGFASEKDLYDNTDRLILAIRDGRPLTAWDWRRVLISAEISFGSDVYGVGWEWETVNQQTDREAVLLLRDIQDKLIAIANSAKPPVDDGPDDLVG